MSKTSDLFNLPTGPAELCFDKNDFMKKTFSADEFLQENRNAATLETMRDDLGIYLKVLRSAMIELINEDYADFVNLSSNLIGLDQSINGIRQPLEQLKTEICGVKQILNETMQELLQCLNEKDELRCNLKSIENIGKVYSSMKKLQILLLEENNNNNNNYTKTNDNANVNDKKLKPIILERSALELIQLEFNIKSCKNLLNTDEINAIENLHKILLKQIQQYFLHIITNTNNGKSNLNELEHCLRIYCTLDECQIAEELFRRICIGPFMNKIISESALQNSPQGLSGIYKQIIQFIDEHMHNLLLLTSSASSEINGGGKLKGFNFLLNSFWCEIENRLETHMSSIFAPGNPDLFYQKYKNTIEFLNQLESIIKDPDAIKAFRQHVQYRKFQTRWNLPVYFQIRFQDIGGAFETTLCNETFDIVAVKNTSTNISIKRFNAIETALNCIEKCWSDGVYLSQLFVKFFKLTLHIFSRLSIWCDECIQYVISRGDGGSKLNLIKSNEKQQTIDYLVLLYLNIVYVKQQIPEYYQLIITKYPENNVINHRHHNHLELIEKCLNDTKNRFDDNLCTIEEQLIIKIVENSIDYIKQVNDIPRLYRKTNKDIPSRPCGYVEKILQTPKQFQQKYSTEIKQEKLHEILVNIFTQLNVHYYNAVEDVLTSVQKTEESLRRLKNLREKTSTANVQGGGADQQRSISSASSVVSGGGSTALSDDDKIRLQLHVDIIHWHQEIEKFDINRSSIKKLNELISLAEDATKIRIN